MKPLQYQNTFFMKIYLYFLQLFTTQTTTIIRLDDNENINFETHPLFEN
jgi:hypothetical protein